jgi:micrococcal nuclease
MAGAGRYIAVAAVGLCLAGQPARPCSLPEDIVRAVVSVLDGDTLLLDDQSRLRLVGAMRPAPPTPDTAESDWPPAAVAKEALERFTTGQSVLLASDQRKADRYGQIFAQAFVVGEDGGFWLQGRMVEQGFARAYSFPDNRQCAAELLALEANARQQHLGLWANAAYGLRDASGTRDLLRYTGSYQLVEGTVVTAVANKGRVFLDFGPDWKSDFSAAVDAGARKQFDAAGLDLTTLNGRRVRVRGWIENSNGPQIRVTHPEQIELGRRRFGGCYRVRRRGPGRRGEPGPSACGVNSWRPQS